MPARPEYRFADPAQLFRGTIVVAVPHMDDEVLACGGTIAQLPEPTRVHLVYATDGARSASVVPWLDATSSELSSVRRAEACAALETVGVARDNLHFLDFPDGELERQAQALEQSFAELIGAIRPDQVLIPFRYDRHPDHLALNRAVHGALQRVHSPAEVFEYFVYYRWRMLRGRDVRAYVKADTLVAVDIERVAARKRAALACFASQTTRYYAWQHRPILSQASLDEVCSHPEVFLRYDPRSTGTAVLTGARAWIRFVHAFEPVAKRRKDQVIALLQRGARGHAAHTG